VAARAGFPYARGIPAEWPTVRRRAAIRTAQDRLKCWLFGQYPGSAGVRTTSIPVDSKRNIRISSLFLYLFALSLPRCLLPHALTARDVKAPLKPRRGLRITLFGGGAPRLLASPSNSREAMDTERVGPTLLFQPYSPTASGWHAERHRL